ncbi:MAG TPA: DUF5362 domain-containing protein [Bacteroidota bacterium]|nr:DUF5362 domain-containing protein [Bacteroidota bacterium]HRT68042.1 DUF5362 domain-containing protein [Bacteroidota bacterium]
MDEDTNLVPENSNLLQTQLAFKMGSDMKWSAILLIIIGALTCVGIVTALIGVPMIIAGLRMNEAAKAFQDYSQSQDQNALNYAIQRQGKSFAILKILVIVYIILTVLYFVLFFTVLLPNLSNLPNFYGF